MDCSKSRRRLARNRVDEDKAFGRGPKTPRARHETAPANSRPRVAGMRTCILSAFAGLDCCFLIGVGLVSRGKRARRAKTCQRSAYSAACEIRSGKTICHSRHTADRNTGRSVKMAEYFPRASRLVRRYKAFQSQAANPIFQHYNYKFIAKRHGPPRLAEEPKPRLKAIQRLILHEILDLAPVHPSVHGFVKKRSCLSAAQIHSGEFIVAALDLRDFFLRTQVSRVHAVFRRLGYPSAVSFLLTGLCINSAPNSVFQTISDDKWHDRETRALYLAPHLPQGAPASPALSNFAAWRIGLPPSRARPGALRPTTRAMPTTSPFLAIRHLQAG